MRNCGVRNINIDLLHFLGIAVLFFIKQCLIKLMSGYKWWLTKVGAKLLSDLVISSILSPDIPIDFHNLIGEVPLKYLMDF